MCFYLLNISLLLMPLSKTLEILNILRNLKILYGVHKSLSLIPALHQMNLAHTHSSCFFRVQFNTKHM
jgi:hypothetical protein